MGYYSIPRTNRIRKVVIAMAYYVNIEAERVRLRLSRPALAERLGMSQNSLSNKINRKRPFTSFEMFELSRLTGKSTEYLLEPDMSPPP
ncbi:MAG: helix-turn-helix domain-containing protein [Oscillospiraceae bacterium]|jgi:transcriptional regulator with XRE-family HTH domain|nr:helix-turn-helix domain-containing protein [Oscillospiraceae bacterium]